MYDAELYENIRNSNIQGSIYITSKLILQDTLNSKSKNIEIIENTFIHIFGYIGTFISIRDINLFIDVIQDFCNIIDDDNIVTKDYYILLTKTCIICDIYNSNPTPKSGLTDIKILRERVISLFENHSFKISSASIKKFEGVLPPVNSDSYKLALQIITGLVHSISQLDEIETDDAEKIIEIANKLRNAFDYIIRRKFIFETKFYTSDNDCVWFLWGIISMLYDDPAINNLYKLYNLRYKKKDRTNRSGLIYTAVLIIVYLSKKDISRNWNKKELQSIKKIHEIALPLFKEIKKDLINSGEIESDAGNVAHGVRGGHNDGLEYIANYKPVETRFSLNLTHGDDNAKKNMDDEEVKRIRYKERH